MTETKRKKKGVSMQLDPQKIITARLDRGLSQQHVAGLGDLSATSVKRAESGLPVQPATARRLARGLGVQIADLRPDGDPVRGVPKETEVVIEQAMSG
jgi:transcriptional regulator with XRE-family HTH domain